MPKRFLDTNDEFGEMEVQEPSVEPSTMEPMTTQSRTSNSSSSVTGGRAHHGETQITKKTTRFNPIDETEQVVMPYQYKSTFNFTTNQQFATVMTFRLNSIYDIIHSFETYNAEKDPVPDTDDGTGFINVPHYRAYWEKLYKYWHVIKCDWKFHFRPSGTSTQAQNHDYCLLFYEHGLQTPPTSADLGGGIKQNIPWILRKYHPHVRKEHIKVWLDNAAGGYSGHVTQQWQTVSGTFKPGFIKHEVVEDELNQTWHKWTEVPPTAEKLTIMMQPEDRSSDSTYTNANNFSITYCMEMEFTVQMKDRIHTFQYLTQGTDFPATDNFLAQPAPL